MGTPDATLIGRFDAYANPDLVAPGDRLLSDDAHNSFLDELLPGKKIKVRGRQTLLELSGTSMAAGVTWGSGRPRR